MMTAPTKPISARTRPPRSQGISLIEVLVAVFTLSIGVLGVAGLQLTAKRSNLEAMQRATAATLTQDIVERMRANPEELATYTAAGAGLTLTGGTMALIDCSGDCTPAQLATYDLYEWEQAVNGATRQAAGTSTGGLVLPTACITGPNGGSGNYTVAIAWRGMTRLSNPVSNACGAGSGRYDGPGGADPDAYRRVLVLETFIVEPT